jgi:hypothetical protein
LDSSPPDSPAYQQALGVQRAQISKLVDYGLYRGLNLHGRNRTPPTAPLGADGIRQLGGDVDEYIGLLGELYPERFRVGKHIGFSKTPGWGFE